jgi:hypothetical protein
MNRTKITIGQLYNESYYGLIKSGYYFTRVHVSVLTGLLFTVVVIIFLGKK